MRIQEKPNHAGQTNALMPQRPPELLCALHALSDHADMRELCLPLLLLERNQHEADYHTFLVFEFGDLAAGLSAAAAAAVAAVGVGVRGSGPMAEGTAATAIATAAALGAMLFERAV